MSIEDINYLKENSIRQSYTFLVDSKSRDRRVHPEPNEYTLDFTVPFKNVVGIEVVDVSVPKTMYNIDYNNNKLYFYIYESEYDATISTTVDENGVETYDKSVFQYIEVPPGDYTTSSFLEKLRLIFSTKGISLDVTAVDTPAELTNMIYFRSSKPFILDMHQSTMAEILGFDLNTSPRLEVGRNGIRRYTYSEYNDKPGFEKLYLSCASASVSGLNTVYAPGMMYLLGNKYIVLKCPEIEQHLYRSLSYTKYNMGLAKIRLNSYGYNDEKTSFLKVPIREFHPIGKLSKMTLRFETNTGDLYDFKGVNHNLVIALYYYEPKHINMVTQSKLNPDYNPNFVKYLYTQDEQEGESDDDEDEFSRDNIQMYRKRELEYDETGIANRNIAIAYHLKKQTDDEAMQHTLLNRNMTAEHFVNKADKGSSSDDTSNSNSNESDGSDESRSSSSVSGYEYDSE
jgi:hypothetical protein